MYVHVVTDPTVGPWKTVRCRKVDRKPSTRHCSLFVKFTPKDLQAARYLLKHPAAWKSPSPSEIKRSVIRSGIRCPQNETKTEQKTLPTKTRVTCRRLTCSTAAVATSGVRVGRHDIHAALLHLCRDNRVMRMVPARSRARTRRDRWRSTRERRSRIVLKKRRRRRSCVDCAPCCRAAIGCTVRCSGGPSGTICKD